MTQGFDSIEDEGMEGLLRGAMRVRSEAVVPRDLAVLAMGRVAAVEAREARLRRLGTWMRVTGMAAGLLLVVTLAVGIYALPAGGDAVGVQESGLTSANSSLDMTSVAMMVLAAAVVGAKVVLTAERPGLRMGVA